jgi:hypothetical protein
MANETQIIVNKRSIRFIDTTTKQEYFSTFIDHLRWKRDKDDNFTFFNSVPIANNAGNENNNRLGVLIDITGEQVGVSSFVYTTTFNPDTGTHFISADVMETWLGDNTGFYFDPNPIGVVVDMTGVLTSVAHDSTLRGDGTVGDPLGVISSGVVFTPTINSTNMVEVSQESDFGTPSVGVITLTANTTYFVRGNVAITNELLVSSGNAIVGFNRDIDKLTYSGSTNLITVVDNDFSMRNIGLCSTNATGKLLDATNITVATPNFYGRTKVLELQNLKIEDTTNLFTIRGFELVDLSNCLFWYISDGTIGCQFQSCRHIEISSCEFYNWFNRATPANLDFYRQIEILANWSVGIGNGVINFNASIIHPELTQIGVYITPTSTTGFGTIASNTFTDTNLTPNIRVSTVTLTGTSGTANILIGCFQNYLVTFNTSLTQTATDFVNLFAEELAFRYGITVTSSGVDIIFTASLAGNVFYITSITNATTNLAGTIANGADVLGVLLELDTDSQNSYIIQANQGAKNANTKGALIIHGNANSLTAPTSYQVLNSTNVGGSFTNSPYFPQATKVITDREACSITYNNKNSGSFFVAVNATVDGTNGIINCRLRFTRGGVTTSLPFALGVTELKGSAEALSFTTLGTAEFGDIFDVEFLRDSAGTLTVTDFTLNGYQF